MLGGTSHMVSPGKSKYTSCRTLKPAFPGKTNRKHVQLVVHSKIRPCAIRYFLFDTTLFGIEQVPIPNDQRIRCSCFDQCFDQ